MTGNVCCRYKNILVDDRFSAAWTRTRSILHPDAGSVWPGATQRFWCLVALCLCWVGGVPLSCFPPVFWVGGGNVFFAVFLRRASLSCN